MAVIVRMSERWWPRVSLVVSNHNFTWRDYSLAEKHPDHAGRYILRSSAKQATTASSFVHFGKFQVGMDRAAQRNYDDDLLIPALMPGQLRSCGLDRYLSSTRRSRYLAPTNSTPGTGLGAPSCRPMPAAICRSDAGSVVFVSLEGRFDALIPTQASYRHDF
jgi:hypothetical protein